MQNICHELKSIIVYKAICSEEFKNTKGSYSNNRLMIHDHKSIKIVTFKFYLTPRTKEI